MAPHDPADRPPFDDDDDEAEPVNWTCRLEVPERSYAEHIAPAGAERRAKRHAAEVLYAAILAHYADYARRMKWVSE